MNPVRARRIAILATIALTTTVLATMLPIGNQHAAQAAGGSITVYNGQHEQTTDALVQAFQRQTGITVNVRSNDEDFLAYQLIEEGQRSPADVIYTENSPALMYLQGQGILAPTNPSTLATVPAAYNSPQGNWVGVSARVSTLVYNTGQLNQSQLPTSVMQLADPQWQGKLAVALGETDFQPIVTSVLKAYGQAATLTWLNGLRANAGNNLYPDAESLTAAVDSGRATIGLINHYYWYRQRAEVGGQNIHSAIAFFSPADPGYVLDVSGAAVLNSSQNQSAAQQFVAFLVSQQGQQIIATSDSFEYPLLPGVNNRQLATAFTDLVPTSLTISDLGDGQAAITLLQQAQLL